MQRKRLRAPRAQREQECLADGMTEDITTGLSRQQWFSVVDRNSSFARKGEAVDIRKLACELGARYVLEGSVRKAGGRIRITAQLVDATKRIHVWADQNVTQGALLARWCPNCK